METIRQHWIIKKAFAKFADKCRYKDFAGVCFRDAPERYSAHNLHPCEIRKCKHTQWIKTKEEIKQ